MPVHVATAALLATRTLLGQGIAGHTPHAISIAAPMLLLRGPKGHHQTSEPCQGPGLACGDPGQAHCSWRLEQDGQPSLGATFLWKRRALPH